jgi:hypothetical protein
MQIYTTLTLFEPTCPERLSSNPIFSLVCVAQSLNFNVVFLQIIAYPTVPEHMSSYTIISWVIQLQIVYERMCSGTVRHALIYKNTTWKSKDWATLTQLQIVYELMHSGTVRHVIIYMLCFCRLLHTLQFRSTWVHTQLLVGFVFLNP